MLLKTNESNLAFEWYNFLKDRSNSVNRDYRSGRLSSYKRPGNNEKVRNFSLLVIRELDGGFGIPETIVNEIFTKNLGMCHFAGLLSQRIEGITKSFYGRTLN